MAAIAVNAPGLGLGFISVQPPTMLGAIALLKQRRRIANVLLDQEPASAVQSLLPVIPITATPYLKKCALLRNRQKGQKYLLVVLVVCI